jgi:tetratricopeptide (TPR) repeat protein
MTYVNAIFVTLKTKMMKYIIATGLVITLFNQNIHSQTLQEAISKTENERYEAAAADFKSLITKEPNKGENYFYYGENYFKNDDLDSALIMYKKGAEISAMYPLNHIGIGKVYLWQGKETDANTNLFKGKTLAEDKSNKNVKAISFIKIADAYTKAPVLKNLPEALKLITEATKIDGKNPEAFILWGDALLEQNPTDGGPAIKQYDKAFELDKKSVKAITRKGKLYERGRNYTEALKFYKEAEGIDATFAPAYREKAEIFIKANRYKEAIENYKKYLELNNSPSARVRFAYALFLAKQYQDAVSEIEQIINKDANSSPYLFRVLGYSYFEITDKTDKEAYKKGSNAMITFFEKTKDKNFKYIPDDYKYLGLLYSKTGQDSLGAIEIEKAITLDSVGNCELWGDIGKIWVKAKRYSKAITAYNKKSSCTKGLTGQDNYDLGRAYYYGPKDMTMADTCFAKLTIASPSYPVGYFWRGKANLQLDIKNEKWLAKPHFEKALELVKPEERGGSYKTNVIEACEYLGYYHVKQKDNAKAKEYFQIVSTLDPNNKKAKDFLASPEGK